MGQRNTILIVDDMASNRIFLKNVLGDEYEYLEAGNGKIALETMQQHHRKIAAVLLDVMMPVKDGFQTLEDLKGSPLLQEFPILVVTSDSGKKSELRVLDLGASDVIIKPYDPAVVKRRVALMIELFAGRRMLENKVDDLSHMLGAVNDSVVNTLATVTEFRSLESGQHVIRIRKFAKILLHAVADLYPDYALTERKINMIASASVLHDVGKVQIPDHILNKPGRLTKEEFEIMKSHTTAGSEILRTMTGVLDDEYMRYAYNICRYHHERWDGKGYPDGLRQHTIPICAQVVALCDVYDALTTPRVYKDAFPHETAVKMIIGGECGQFNPEIIGAFGVVLDQFRDCAKEYADNGVVSEEEKKGFTPMTAPPAAEVVVTGADRLAEKRWRALCQMINGVVLEVDVDQDSYRVLHGAGTVFESFGMSSHLNEMLMEMLNKAIHPEDKMSAAEQIVCLQKEFFEQGLRYHAKRIHIRYVEGGEYHLVNSVCLRINTGRVTDRKALWVWQNVHEGDCLVRPQEDAAMMSGAEWGEKLFGRMPWTTVRCRQDKWLTIEDGAPLLAELLGYTEQELQEVSEGRLLNLIWQKDREGAMNKLSRGGENMDVITAEYRLRHKNGEPVYVMDESRMFVGTDGVEHTCKALLDVTAMRREQERMRTIEDRYDMLMAYADEIFFVWDIVKDEAFFADNFRKTFGYEVQNDSFSKRLVNGGGLIHAEDMEAWNALVRDIHAGMTPAQQEMRIAKADGSYIWCRVRVVGQQHGNGETTEVLGAITNINTDKLMVQNLRQAAECDALTGLCNIGAAKRLTETYLQGISGRQEQAALIIMDLDNFKQVNDRYGHLMGDAVLMSCGDMLKHRFRPYDVVARMGGDEFMVLVCDVPDYETVKGICEQVLERFRSEIAIKVPECDISCSMGVVMIPDGGAEVDDLLARADKALRYSKGCGKDRMTFYRDIGDEEVVYLADRTAIESDARGNIGKRGLMEYALHMLYRSEDLEDAIQTILAMAARQANVSRAYIFENLPDNRSCRNSFEWCAPGVSSLISRRKSVNYAQWLPGWRDLFDKSGVFRCDDTATLPPRIREVAHRMGAKALLCCAIVDEGVFRGFVGFESDVEKRVWTQDQMGYLTSLAEVLSMFLLKKRNKENANAWAAALHHIMAKKNGWVEVIRDKDYGLCFLNDPSGKLQVHWEKGEPCYRTLMGRETPCEVCPLNNLGEAVELHCAKLEWSALAKATYTSWEGENVYLLLCEEISGEEEIPAVNEQGKENEN